MHQGNRTLRMVLALVTAALTALALGACGSSSGGGKAANLLQQTFSGAHRVNSGNLNFSLTISPSGSSTLKGPITLSFGGPFQSLGTGKLPQSNFNVTLNAMGSGGSVGILSTGTSGYVTFRGASYQLPHAAFQRLESSFSQLASPAGSSGSGVLGKLGIQPLHWLVNPKVVGDESVAGAPTTHVRAGINLAALLSDFNTFLQKASTLGVSGASSFPNGISAASRSRIAGEVQNPSFDVWTGKADRTIRKLQINLTLPVTGQTSTLLGGLRTAGIGLSMQYANLNQPQTITAPTSVQPYSLFQTKLRTLLTGLQTGLGSALSGGAGSGTSGSSTGSGAGSGASGAGTTTGSAGSGTTASYQAYSRCIQATGGDVAKMQQCASLLNGK
jgi:hypothetical protein